MSTLNLKCLYLFSYFLFISKGSFGFLRKYFQVELCFTKTEQSII